VVKKENPKTQSSVKIAVIARPRLSSDFENDSASSINRPSAITIISSTMGGIGVMD
jgi:hypothetical protein